MELALVLCPSNDYEPFLLNVGLLSAFRSVSHLFGTFLEAVSKQKFNSKHRVKKNMLLMRKVHRVHTWDIPWTYRKGACEHQTLLALFTQFLCINSRAVVRQFSADGDSHRAMHLCRYAVFHTESQHCGS